MYIHTYVYIQLNNDDNNNNRFARREPGDDEGAGRAASKQSK